MAIVRELRHTVAPVTIIRPSTGWVSPRFRDAWEHRELLYYFVSRDVKVRYAQTLLGAFWAFFQPVAMMLVFTFAFRKLGNVQTENIPYPVYAFAGLTFWVFFSRAVLSGADSLVSNAALLTKTSLPRLLLPLSATVSALVDFAITFGLLIVLVAFYGYYPTWRIAFVPIVMVVGITLAVGVSLLLSAVNVRHRDIRNVLPMFVQLLLFITPVVYTLNVLGVTWTNILSANPLVGIVQSFRWAVIGTGPPTHVALFFMVGVTGVLFIAGLVYFSRTEANFADVA